MIAFIAKNIRSGRAILQAEFPKARVLQDRRVFLDGERPMLTGLICTNEDHLRGLELSGFVVLDELDAEMLHFATARLRKPFYWHVRTEDERNQVEASK